MSDSIREQILDHIASTLAAVTETTGRVYRSRVEAFARDEAPALVVEPARDNATPVSTNFIDWALSVTVAAHTRGAIPDQLADPILQQIHSLLAADRTLGGLAKDCWPESIEFQRDPADQASGWTVCTYRVSYRTMVTDLTAQQ